MNDLLKLLIPHEPKCIGALGTAAVFLVIGVVILVKSRRNGRLRNEASRRTHIYRP